MFKCEGEQGKEEGKRKKPDKKLKMETKLLQMRGKEELEGGRGVGKRNQGPWCTGADSL